MLLLAPIVKIFLNKQVLNVKVINELPFTVTIGNKLRRFHLQENRKTVSLTRKSQSNANTAPSIDPMQIWLP